ncbi:leucyl/phenylalanyl-tRNA--protein transferase [Snodgrassella alvi]|uniref:Leucyl/phenylalanyl-tRNA--protein transferase n=1 Tax=Snodgrassella alvi TaxID=1196083 RepID=A0A2N9WRX3_9NEIS|nr:leucyl/phenylalanyl-tRNA--protein transferase [Snodgrassella alvi]PIT13037.1 leucyl/phenylalanyl-tRNA--protein transferase [Snodgrassella alvi]PIT15768.1 leucyl/phenylalanyl-tRNA--protein transferase [Snodgrassella alvi]PIT18919.1 leucyl/phenylalanyl-tRNA--protein transferase [Snodgrassella alvi]
MNQPEYRPCIPVLCSENLDFPDIEPAQSQRDGLVAIGGDLSPARILAAYRRGIFPWYAPDEPIMWWAFAQRMVLLPAELKISRSLAKNLRNKPYAVTMNYAFRQVITNCAQTPRNGQNGTWLVPEMQQAYYTLHQQQHACSFECWYQNAQGQAFLAGGLYGVLLGQIFYGESMFAHAGDASKIAFVHAVHYLQQQGVPLIDCQVYTDYLASFGAREIPFTDFAACLHQFNAQPLPLPVKPQVLADNGVIPLPGDSPYLNH